METIQIKPIKELPIPEKQKLGAKESKIPELLKTINKGCRAAITNTFTKTVASDEKSYWITKDQPKIATITSYLNKQQKKGQLKQYTFEQRSNTQNNTRTITLYITHEGKQ